MILPYYLESAYLVALGGCWSQADVAYNHQIQQEGVGIWFLEVQLGSMAEKSHTTTTTTSSSSSSNSNDHSGGSSHLSGITSIAVPTACRWRCSCHLLT
jgi:hypothetical protein